MDDEERNERKWRAEWWLLAGLIVLGGLVPSAAAADQDGLAETHDHADAEVAPRHPRRLIRADGRLSERESIPSLAAPLVLIPVGIGVGLLGAATVAMASFCIDWSGDCETDEEMRNLGIGLAIVGGLTFAMGAFVLLPMKVAQRRAWRERRDRSRVRVTPTIGRRGGSLLLSASF